MRKRAKLSLWHTRCSHSGVAPPRAKAKTALLLIDVINDLEFPGAHRLMPHALRAAKRIASLKRRAQEARVPVIYVNDNFGHWRSDFNAMVQHALRPECPGRAVATLLLPA